MKQSSKVSKQTSTPKDPDFIYLLILLGIYWANFRYRNNWVSYLQLTALGVGLYVVSGLGYHYLWTNLLGHSAPAGFGFIIGITISIWTVYFLSWFRYILKYFEIRAKQVQPF